MIASLLFMIRSLHTRLGEAGGSEVDPRILEFRQPASGPVTVALRSLGLPPYKRIQHSYADRTIYGLLILGNFILTVRTFHAS